MTSPRVRCAALAACLTVGLGLASPSTADAAPCRRGFGDATASTCQQNLDWRYDPRSRSFVRDGEVQRDESAASPRARYIWQRQERCDDRGASCPAAALTCRRDAERGYRYLVTGRRLLPGGKPLPGPAEIVTTECVYPQTVVPASAIQDLVAREVRKRVGRPAITTSPPGGRTLVNIPTLYSTTRYPQVRLPVTAPVPGALTAVPEWVWTFPDTSQALGPGIAYDPTIDPLRNPDAYVNTVYPSPGPQTVTLTLTWRVTFALQDLTDVDLAPITFTNTATTTAMTATNRLLAPPRR